MSTPLGSVWAAGNNNGCQLGDGTTDQHDFLRNALVPGPEDGVSWTQAVVTAVAAGAEHSLALGVDGTVWIWGSILTSMLKLPVQVPGLESIIAISAGYGFSLALRADGTVWSWGVNDKGQLGDGTKQARKNVVQVKGSGGQGALSNIVAVAAAPGHCLALDDGGMVWTWGFNSTGQLGDGSTKARSTPALIPGLDRVIAIAGGGGHSLALKADGTVKAWGSNNRGQLGDGSINQHNQPTPIPSLSGIVAIAAGSEHSLALHYSGQVWSWGSNTFGELGNDTVVDSHSPIHVVNGPGSTQPLNSIAVIAAGATHTLLLRFDGEPRACGYNNAGRLGDGTEIDRHTPVPMLVMVGNEKRILKVSALAGGALHSLIIEHGGESWGWGANGSHQLTDAAPSGESATAVQQTPNCFPKDIAAGAFHSLAISGGAHHIFIDKEVKGRVWAWGANTEGQLADVALKSGSVVDTTIPGIGVSAGGGHGLALRPDGTVMAWGANDAGQVGAGVAGPKLQPPAIVKGVGGDGQFQGVKAVAAGLSHSLALKADGTVWAWGANDKGQLGVNSIVNHSTPVQVKAPSGIGVIIDIIAIAAGGEWSLALRADGAVWAWGLNDKGQLGNTAALKLSKTPVQVMAQLGDLPRMKAISAGSAHGLALKADGTVWAWGWNSHGELGDGSTKDRTTAAAVKKGPKVGRAVLTNAKAIAAGGTMKQSNGGHSLALVAHGEVFGWGFNVEGQLGIDTKTKDQLLPNTAVQTLTEPDPDLGGQQYSLPLPRVAGIAAGALHSLAIGPRKPPIAP